MVKLLKGCLLGALVLSAGWAVAAVARSGNRSVARRGREARQSAFQQARGAQEPMPAAQALAKKTQSREQTARPTVRVQSNLVLVPALVTTRAGDVVFSLTADDFLLTDNGVPQMLRLEQNTDSEPLALAVAVETGADGASHLRDYRHLGPVLSAFIGGVRHRVAVISFDDRPKLVIDFTPDTDAAARAIAKLPAGDEGAAILDAVSLGIDILRKQPAAYRRAILLISGTADSVDLTSLGNLLREVDDTNTEIYAVAFSSTKAAVARQASKLPIPGGTDYGNTPYGPGGCMSKGSDPDAHGKRSVQVLDCASDLLPPLRFVRMAFLAMREGAKRNLPETVAQLTGGEYFAFKNANTLVRDLMTLSNHLPNGYVLTFRPESPTAGYHLIKVSVKGRPQLKVRARSAYWVDAESAPRQE